MTGDSINLLLETFQELTRRGKQAKLFLETRNGEQYGTLSVKSHPSKPAERGTWRNPAKNTKKSPSTIRRDQRRLRSFLERKSAQESPGNPNAASTPISKPGLDSSSQEISRCDVTSEILEDNQPDNEMKIDDLENQTKIETVQEIPIMSPEELADSKEDWLRSDGTSISR